MLLFRSLGNVYCGDGSPAGLYTDLSHENETRRDHVIFFQGGGVCESEMNCREEYESERYKFSSQFFPESVEGDTILSNDPAINPKLSEYVKWLVPYCSQDLYMGAGQTKVAGLHRAGSNHFQGTLMYMREHVPSINRLVFAGASAGAIGVANHVHHIQQTAIAFNATSVHYILDSSMFSDQKQRDYSLMTSDHINVTDHPLCLEGIAAPTISYLPCCLSIHCMLRHKGSPLASIVTKSATSSIGPNERVLLLDAIYDAHAVPESLGRFLETPNTFFEYEAYGWAGGEIAGSRSTRVRESLFKVNEERAVLPGTISNAFPQTTAAQDSSIVWITPSCLTHSFLLPSLELEAIKCAYQNGVRHDLAYDFICRVDAIGVRSKKKSASFETRFTQWLSRNTWRLASIGTNQTVESYVNQFLDTNSSNLWQSKQLIYDECHGPNCLLERGSTHSCQTLFESEAVGGSIPLWFQSVIFAYLALMMCSFTFRWKWMEQLLFSRKRAIKNMQASKSCDQSNTGEMSVEGPDLEPNGKGLGNDECGKNSVAGLSVSTKKGKILLNDIHLWLLSGSVNGLLGKSGSGKSTLLSALSGQLQRGLTLTCSEQETNWDFKQTTFLRQHDRVTLDNMSPYEYLKSCAEIYGGESTKRLLLTLQEFVRASFPSSKRINGKKEYDDDPFLSSKIAVASGGQRRVLATAAALLMKPSVLLLDEPLSGLDSVSCERLMAFLKAVSQETDCAVLMTIHQPSSSVLDVLDQVCVLSEGSLVMSARQTDLKRVQSDSGRGLLTLSEALHELISISDLEAAIEFGAKMQEAGSTSSSRDDSIRGLDQTTGESTDYANQFKGSPESASSESKIIGDGLSQVCALSRRLQLNYGSNWTDVFVLPVVFIVLALVLNLEAGSMFQSLFAASFFLVVPVVIFQHHLLFAKNCWEAHRLELDDRRITRASYLVASMTFSMALPIISLLISHIVGYAVLGYIFSETFLVQYLFAGIYLLVIVEFGRVLCLVFWGRYIYWKLYLIGLSYNLLFAGLVVSLNHVPSEIYWLFGASYTFWGVSGVTLNQFQFNTQIGDQPCQSFASCVAFDGNVLAGVSGFTVLSTPYRAMGVLVVVYAVELALEFWLLGSRRTQHAVNPSHSEEGKKEI